MRAATILTTTLREVRYRTASMVKGYPTIYMPLIAARKRDFDGSPMGVTSETRIVIDAYPRSGNTFATRAFMYCQQRPVAVAHHLHAPAAIASGVRRHLPVLTIIRKPADAVVSLAVFRACQGYDRRWNLTRALKDYVAYYEQVAQWRHAIVMASFDDVITDFGAVIRHLNEYYETSFDVFQHTPEAVAAVNARLDAAHGWWMQRHGLEHSGRTDPRPDRRRASEQQVFREEFHNPAHASLRQRAEDIYAEFQALCLPRSAHKVLARSA